MPSPATIAKQATRAARAIRAALLLLAAGALGLSACGVASVAPMVPWQEKEFDPALLGTWTNSDGKEVAVITGDSAADYQVEFTDDDGKVGLFDARLGRLGPHRVLDLRPNANALGRQSAYYESLVYRLHALVVVDRVTATQLDWRIVNPDSLQALLRREPGVVAHETYEDDDGVVLTAGTPELRRFLAGVVNRPGAMSDTAKYVRRR